ncbi:hypothetical protein [Actinomadura parmotrematis]|uniref:HEAT repeat domain-containing protein n=1 Tax=Actinomadura parmotrematis TaxID=2864039 RepID=A0ABS7FQA7_9ACTN|nr:hypothetical protein [Actinomadura parmotrematis]MBW8481733.1 hypothetical protein [Actinomadura parmotrematis]
MTSSRAGRPLSREAATALAREFHQEDAAAGWTRLDGLTSADWPRLAAALRSRDLRSSRLPWNAPPPADAFEALLMACSHNGHLRERALTSRYFTGAFHGDVRLLPIAVVCATDHVPQVREAARRSLERLLGKADLPGTVEAADIASLLAGRSRGDAAALTVAILRREVPGLLEAARTAGGPRLRRVALRLWLEQDPAPEDLTAAALAEKDTLARTAYAEAVEASGRAACAVAPTVLVEPGRPLPPGGGPYIHCRMPRSGRGRVLANCG